MHIMKPMTTKKQSKLSDKQVRLRAKIIRDYGIANFIEDAGIKRGTLNPVLSGFRDFGMDETEKVSERTGIPLKVLDPVAFDDSNNVFIKQLRYCLENKKETSTPYQWNKITKEIRLYLS